MKRTVSERNQPFLRHRYPVYPTAPFRPNQTLFRNRCESGNAVHIRNNLQLSLLNEDQINLRRLFSYEGLRGQFRPHLAVENQHRAGWPRTMNPFMPGARHILRPMTRMLRPRGYHGAVISNRFRTVDPRIPSTARQFLEIQRNARLAGSLNAARSFSSNTKNEQKGRFHRNKIFMRRKWQALPEAEQCQSHEFSFSLVTYNMLSDALLYENISLYEDCSQDALNWEYRKNKLLAELIEYDAEILCLQEVDACHYENWFLPKLLEAGYTGVFNQRTGGKPDGCAIFYRHAKFTLIKQKLVKFYTPKVHVLDKDNVGIVLLLKANTTDPNAESPFICIANTHLLFNKKRGDIKLAQLAYLFAEIHELAVLSQDDCRKTHCPVILCGDLNSLPYSPLYNLLITGQLDYSIRSPAVISGQLAPSVTERAGNARRIRTPLLPWKFGVTANCQWREQRQGISQGIDSSESQDPNRSIQADPGKTTDVITEVVSDTIPDCRSSTSISQYSASSEINEVKDADSARQPNPSSGRCNEELSKREVGTADNPQRSVIDTFPGYRPSSSTNRYSASSGVNDLKNRDLASQRKPGFGACNQGLRERQVETIEIPPRSSMDLNISFDRYAESDGCSEAGRVPGRNVGERQEYVESCSPRGKDGLSVELNSKGDPHRTTARQSKRNAADVIDLTQDIDDELSMSNPIEGSGWFKGCQSRDVEVIDLTETTDSSSSSDIFVESNNEEKSFKDRDLKGASETDKGASCVGDTPTSSPRPSGFESQKAEHNQNGIISIPWRLTSVYAHRFPDGSPEVTTCHSKACCNVDYIFYTAGFGGRQSPEPREYVQAGELTLLGKLELMRKSDFNSMQLLPNRLFPSDHLSLQAKFKLT